jgi:hypothetical protein
MLYRILALKFAVLLACAMKQKLPEWSKVNHIGGFKWSKGDKILICLDILHGPSADLE